MNDYLAKRDSIEMGKIYKFLGLTSGYINNDQNDDERKITMHVILRMQQIVSLVLIILEIT